MCLRLRLVHLRILRHHVCIASVVFGGIRTISEYNYDGGADVSDRFMEILHEGVLQGHAIIFPASGEYQLAGPEGNGMSLCVQQPYRTPLPHRPYSKERRKAAESHGTGLYADENTEEYPASYPGWI